ncbi:esterase, PHB depolymerase family [Sphingomonas guangdongensis]|uniref:Esterase, PHB depolymerase family n=1 Tax=Sphingomonas guangdongensis TaxID=1141890 RepID=A0A285QBH8_9SPHN|nr:PHB depolymerase family esterase [Sphingomonas guangdongensis]SOB78868.1 esterase, PHB depolymerase family [Sphingomonas guangdongensis]
MRKLSDTITRLSALRSADTRGGTAGSTSRLTRLDAFGSNPGALQAYTYIPASLGAGAALVVVLHGCTQTAAGYDTGAGWSEMADRHGFALLFPEQQRKNNPNLCFNWFSPEDNRRGSGEALSIREMIEAVAGRHGIDPARIFVTGLSAGGAMSSVMLATYPEVFAGGAIIAGLPYGSASTVPQAFDRMRGTGGPNPAELASLVRNASDHHGPWPTISVWHGSGDATVNPVNAEAILSQWRPLHGVDQGHSRLDVVDGYPRRVWSDGAGREVIEEYSVTGMAHGTPLDTTGVDGCGKAGAYMLEASISSTRHVCRFWGLAPTDTALTTARPAEREGGSRVSELAASPKGLDEPSHSRATPSDVAAIPGASAVGKIIEDALRAAGLMR